MLGDVIFEIFDRGPVTKFPFFIANKNEILLIGQKRKLLKPNFVNIVVLVAQCCHKRGEVTLRSTKCGDLKAPAKLDIFRNSRP